MASANPTQNATAFWVYVGNYGEAQPKGIYLQRFDAKTGTLASAGLAAPAQAANFVIIHPNGKFLYAVTLDKIADYKGTVESFAIDARTGKLTPINRQPSGGDNPCHLAIDPTGKILIVANYSGGTIAAYPLDPDGRINPPSEIVHHQGSNIHPKRQNKPYTHGITFDHSGKNILVPDLGMNQILRYQVDTATGSLRPTGAASVPPGAGPRHVALHPESDFFYVINELIPSISVFRFSPTDPMPEIQNLNPWPQNPAFSGAEIEIHPNGKFLYASNRGHDTIAYCAIHPFKGEILLLALVPSGGKTPRHFALDPTAQFMLISNQDSNRIDVFRVNPDSGMLAPTGQSSPADQACCVAFVPVQT